ncbi:hypothetical protein [Candidatus Magnetaquicoccus inordinatus]|uniref:hypothetical protein n=1 Tax=Candidatus Magnetaquicoccus inordinatus TaxID=2496818 RepID=UPI00102AA959|nr:hypothetical protein [Candidatus Magnetaquicoccus inordinatus]
MGISIRSYARQRDITEGAVRKAVKSGRIPVEADGTIDPAKANVAWERNTSPAQQRKPDSVPAKPAPVPAPANPPPIRQPSQRPAEPESGPVAAGMPNYQMSRAVRETYNAKLTRLDYEERTGKLLNAEDVAKEAFALARRVRDRLLNIPSRMASVLASETDSKTIESMLSQELRIALEELAE